MKKVYAPYLAVIQESIAAIDSYRPANKDAFLASPVLQDAVLMRLQVIGENLVQMRTIDEKAFEQQAADSWNKVVGHRPIISDGYKEIDLDRIWHTITVELPAFAQTITAATDVAE